jgi:hypothetical protein
MRPDAVNVLDQRDRRVFGLDSLCFTAEGTLSPSEDDLITVNPARFTRKNEAAHRGIWLLHTSRLAAIMTREKLSN